MNLYLFFNNLTKKNFYDGKISTSENNSEIVVRIFKFINLTLDFIKFKKINFQHFYRPIFLRVNFSNYYLILFYDIHFNNDFILEGYKKIMHLVFTLANSYFLEN